MHVVLTSNGRGGGERHPGVGLDTDFGGRAAAHFCDRADRAAGRADRHATADCLTGHVSDCALGFIRQCALDI